MSSRVSNNFTSLANHFGTGEDIPALAEALEKAGSSWVSNTRAAVLRQAGMKGTPADIDVLVARGYDLNLDTRQGIGESILHVAAASGATDNVRHLIQHHGMDPNLVLYAGRATPLNQATANACGATMAVLITLGAGSPGAWTHLFQEGGRLLAGSPQSQTESGDAILENILNAGDVLAEKEVPAVAKAGDKESPLFALLDNLVFDRPWTWPAVSARLERWPLDLNSVQAREDVIRTAARNDKPEKNDAVMAILSQLRARQQELLLERQTAPAPGVARTPRL